jgi:hypothetical protein
VCGPAWDLAGGGGEPSPAPDQYAHRDRNGITRDRLLGARHAARLRGAISGKHKSDVIDADVLARAGEVFDLHPLRPVDPAQLALRRACVRRGTAVIDGNRYLRRLISLDVWNGFRWARCGQRPSTATAVGNEPRKRPPGQGVVAVAEPTSMASRPAGCSVIATRPRSAAP